MSLLTVALLFSSSCMTDQSKYESGLIDSCKSIKSSQFVFQFIPKVFSGIEAGAFGARVCRYHRY